MFGRQTDRALLQIRQIRMLLKLSESDDVVEAVDRLVRQRDLGTYDRAGAEHAREEARRARMLFVATILSQPTGRLTLTRIARAAVWASAEICTSEDPATGNTTYFLRER